MRTEKYRASPFSDNALEGGISGEYLIPVDGSVLAVIVADGLGWDHVSVSVRRVRRCPTWTELERIRELFFHDDETVVYYSPPRDLHINLHAFVLHMWRPQAGEIPLPPSFMV